jgi:hypothetical protein
MQAFDLFLYALAIITVLLLRATPATATATEAPTAPSAPAIGGMTTYPTAAPRDTTNPLKIHPVYGLATVA